MDRRSQALFNWVNALPGWQVDNFHMISGDASFRRYFRFSSPNQLSADTFIAVDAPPETEKNSQFVALSQALLALGVRVPKVLQFDDEHGWLLLEDFGDALFSVAIDNPTEAPALYQRALAILPQLQKLPELIQEQVNTAPVLLPEYDHALLSVESDMFSHWLLEVHLGLSLTVPQQALVAKAQGYLNDVFFEQPQVGVHRDFHSRNLMLLAADENAENNLSDAVQIGVIDFQDAVTGPLTYDMVSLLRDCYVVWPDEFVTQQLQNLHQSSYSQYPWPQFKHWFDCTGMQRHLKAAGIFARLCHRDGKQHYLSDIPRTLRYVINVGQQLSLTDSLQWMADFAELIATVVLPVAEKRVDRAVESVVASTAEETATDSTSPKE